MKKRILFLGGSYAQVPAIKFAKNKGYHVITVDYLPNNPGHKFSDEYYNISTVNKDEILDLAKQLNIDAISAYASDPAAPTAAFVSEKLNLVGSPYQAVEILSNKNLFREFLWKNNFNVPWYISGSDKKQLKNEYNGEKAILKPVDSSGSKGIFIINDLNDLESYFYQAINYSRSGNVILEQFIEHKGPQIHGEGFVVDGELIFILMGDQVFSNVNRLAPYSTFVPSVFHEDIMKEAINEVKKAIKKVGFETGGINIELIRDKRDKIYILEIGARNGGNFMPQLMKHATGFDLVAANINAILGKNVNTKHEGGKPGFYAQIILHADSKGIFGGIQIPDDFKNLVVDQTIYFTKGDRVNMYQSSKDVIGVLIIYLINKESLEQLKHYLQSNSWTIIE